MRIKYRLVGVIVGLLFSVFALAETQTPSAESAAEPGFVSLYPTYPTPDYTTADPKLIKRGEYLVKIGDCISCHTDATKGGKPFSGGLAMNTPFGVFYTPNITSDKKTGIGEWTDKQFIRAMHEGKRADGKNLFPVFPYLYFNKVTEDDLLAIKAYLFSIPKVSAKNKGNELPFPLNVRFFQLGWKLMFFQFYKGPIKYDASQTAQWNRGRYITEGLGHCAMCHTPMNPLGAPKRSHHLTGGFVDGFWAPNITKLGLGGASVSEVVDVFKKEKLLHDAGKVQGPMAEVDHNSLNYLTNKDLTAIAVYLESIESKETNWAEKLAGEKDSVVGKKIYYAKCAECHNENPMGAPVIGDAANWKDRYKQGITKLYQHTIKGYNQMPYMGNCPTCSKAEIRSAVNYLLAHSLSADQMRLVFIEPPRKLTSADGKRIYRKNCASCHAQGKNGAPKVGDKLAWAPLIAKNMDVLFDRTIKGVGDKRHIKGGCETCSNAEVIAAIKYMVEKSKTKGDYSLW